MENIFQFSIPKPVLTNGSFGGLSNSFALFNWVSESCSQFMMGYQKFE